MYFLDPLLKLRLHESIGTRMSRFSWSSTLIVKYQFVLATPLIFVDVGENSIMVDDIVMPLNLLVTLVEEEEFEEASFEEASFDVNVSQWSRKEKLFLRMVCIQINCLT